MHKLVASLLLFLSAAALLSSQEAARATPSPRSIALGVQASLNGHLVNERADRAAEGDYFDLDLGDGVLVSYRLAAVSDAGVRVEAVVVRDGATVSEPTVELARDASQTITVESSRMTLELRIDAG